MVVEDIEEGDGAEAKSGDTVSVNYVGVLYENGEEFDASFNTGQPFEFQLGAGNVIPGWDQGVEGMKVGGRRQLIIPPELAYGAQGSPPDIPPNSTLVFVIDLLSVN
ncbi:MAG: FKBP-type peptidyl-prolyl cis-trans isomerase [Solirubrobacterales bacterium]